MTALAALLGVTLYLWLLQSSDRARRQSNTIVTTLRAQTIRFEQEAAEYERLRALPAKTSSTTALRVLVQAQTDASGLSRAQVRIDAPDPNRVQVVFGAVSFADWLAWLTSLQAQQIRLDSSRIEALPTAGLVSVSATLVRAK